MRTTIACLALIPAVAFAQGTAPPPVRTPPPPGAPGGAAPAATPYTLPGPPIRKIESATHVSKELLGAISGVRQLSNGRVLVNDGTRRRLLMLDSTLTSVQVVLDSASDTENAYGTALGGIIAYRGDSTLFIDRASYAMLVLDGNGKIARVRAVPTTNYLSNLTSGNTVPGVDASGRLVMRIQAKPAPPPPNLPANAMYFPQPPDSALIVRLDLNTRKLDTAGVIRIPKSTLLMTQRPDGGIVGRSMVNPFPTTDEWAVLSDGTIAYLRGRDYRIDWQDEEDAVTSSPKLPYDWVRMSDDDKAHMADSIKKVMADVQANQYYFQMMSWVNMYGQQYPKDFVFPSTLTLPSGLPGNWTLPPGYVLPPGYERGPAQAPIIAPPSSSSSSSSSSATASASAAAAPNAKAAADMTAAKAVSAMDAAAAPGNVTVVKGKTDAAMAAPAPMPTGMMMGMTIPPMPTQATTAAIAMASVVPPDEWPDYKPPFAVGAARADADGNLWVRINLMHPIPGGIIYDVINRKGELFDRIQLPAGHTLVGFGPGRVVYLSLRDAAGLHLERVRLK